MFDDDLAEIYEVKTKRLKEAVRRNIRRFPSDFMFEVTPHERKQAVEKQVLLKPIDNDEITILRTQKNYIDCHPNLRSQFASSRL